MVPLFDLHRNLYTEKKISVSYDIISFLLVLDFMIYNPKKWTDTWISKTLFSIFPIFSFVS